MIQGWALRSFFFCRFFQAPVSTHLDVQMTLMEQFKPGRECRFKLWGGGEHSNKLEDNSYIDDYCGNPVLWPLIWPAKFTSFHAWSSMEMFNGSATSFWIDRWFCGFKIQLQAQSLLNLHMTNISFPTQLTLAQRIDEYDRVYSPATRSRSVRNQPDLQTNKVSKVVIDQDALNVWVSIVVYSRSSSYTKVFASIPAVSGVISFTALINSCTFSYTSFLSSTPRILVPRAH